MLGKSVSIHVHECSLQDHIDWGKLRPWSLGGSFVGSSCIIYCTPSFFVRWETLDVSMLLSDCAWWDRFGWPIARARCDYTQMKLIKMWGRWDFQQTCKFRQYSQHSPNKEVTRNQNTTISSTHHIIPHRLPLQQTAHVVWKKCRKGCSFPMRISSWKHSWTLHTKNRIFPLLSPNCTFFRLCLLAPYRLISCITYNQLWLM